MNQPRRHGTLAVLAVATVFLLGLDMSRPGATSFLRTGAAAAFGPLETVLAVGKDDEVTRLTRQRDELVRLRQQDAAMVRKARDISLLMASPSAKGARLLSARVVGFSKASSGERRVTIDVGSSDGVSKNLTVVAGAGLVGRVVSVAEWTSDVLVVGDRGLTVGVRVGKGGLLASATAAPRPSPGMTTRGPGQLSLTLLEQGTVVAGDGVTTLGSVDGTPFLPDILVGTVVSVDPDRGQLTSTAVLEPAVDTATLDVVGVILSTERTAVGSPAAGSAKRSFESPARGPAEGSASQAAK